MDDIVSLTKAQVPSYLVGSDFYNSLCSDDSEVFSIPQAFFKPNSDVIETAHLSHLFHTMRFWGLHKLPHNIIKLLVLKSSPRSDVDEQGGLEYVYIKDSQSNAAMVKAAAENGHLSLLQRVHDDLVKASKYPFTGVSLRNVAMHGHAECLRFLLERGYKKDMHVCRIAAEKGHLACLKFVQDNGCVVTENTAYEAAKGGHTECLRYVLDQGVLLTKRLCNAAATHGHLACLQLLRERNCPCGIECSRLAASHGHVDCMKFLLAAANGHERRCEIRGGKAVHEAAKAGHAGCLQVLRQYDASINDADFLKEIKESDDSYLRLLIEAGFSIPVGAVRTVIEDRNLARLD
eukprot:gene15453-17673_t